MVINEQFPLRAPFNLHFAWLQLAAATHEAGSQTTELDPQGDIINDSIQACRRRLLPAACQRKENYTFYEPEWTIDWFSEQFDLQRLEDVEPYLWLAGRPMPPRPLLYQKSAGREIIITHQMDMHLLWESKRLYLRPVPSYVFSKMFWKEIIHICGADCYPVAQKITEKKKKAGRRRPSRTVDGHCKRCTLYTAAMGFLHSYVALIPENIDFRIAQKAGLVPSEMSWDDWRLFVSEFLTANSDNLVNVHKRFFHGELRLGRLNKIYKFTFRDWRGYRYRYHEYGDFTSRYLGSIAVFTGYVVVALTAMQVGLSNNYFREYDSFQRATYQFTIFSILGPLVLVALVLVAVVVLILLNLWDTRKFLKKRRRRWDYPD